MTTNSGIQNALKQAGTQVKLAAALGVSQQIVSMWLKRGWVPLQRAKEIEILYGVPRSTLINPRIADVVDLPNAGSSL